MPDLISDEYREQNRLLHEREDYGHNGARYKDTVLTVMDRTGARTILDYGCGKGSLRKALGPFVSNYDPAVPEFAGEPEPADLVVCTDVVEHVEPDMLDAVLDHIKSLGQHYLLIVSCREAHKTLPDGRNAHLIVQPPEWWDRKMKERFTVLFHYKEADLAVFVCR